ncbi:MAG: ATP-binding protein [Cyanobacteria bacterium J06634_6]
MTEPRSQESLTEIQQYRQQAAALLLYQSVFASDIGQAFLALLEALMVEDAITAAQAYGQWFSALATKQQSWQQHLTQQILLADNAFSQQAQTLPTPTISAPVSKDQLTKHIPPAILSAVNHDLKIIKSFYQLPADQPSQWLQTHCGITVPPALPFDLSPSPSPSWWLSVAEATTTLATHYRAHGVGTFGQFTAFRWQSNSDNADGQLIGIPTPDPINLSQLVAYDHPKQQLIQNTESLLQGYTAQNVLLYGSRGAGKSSLVKALLNEYHTQGLRLIEVPKAHLHNLPQIIGPLSRVPQKFIIFVDDLSFEEDDEAFKALKVVLEGGVTARPQNVVVYATSNRRHLIREFFDERPKPKDADEIQAWDTVQEKLSFSDRFGLTLTFTPADQPTYLTIVHELAAQANIQLDPDNLDWRARQWATRHNGRSGRTARQFVDFLIAEQGFKRETDD